MSTRSRRRAEARQELARHQGRHWTPGMGQGAARGNVPPASVPPVLGDPGPQSGGLRVLFLGDTAGTGFGTVTRDLALAMVRRGMDVRILSMNEDAGVHVDPHWPDELKPRTVMLGVPSGWAGITRGKADAIVTRAMGVFSGLLVPGWRPEVVLVVGDHSSVEQSPWPELIPKDIPAYHYVPIEGVDLPPSWGRLWERFRPVAMTRFGADEIAKVTGEAPPVVYHGINPESFWKVSPQRPLVLKLERGKTHRLTSRLECRAFLGWPLTGTIMFRADRLMPRKTYPAMLRSIAPVLARHQDAWMVMHCHVVDQGGSLHHEVSKYPDFIQARMVNTGLHAQFRGGVPRPLLTAMYNAADLYISTSAEGFGLTVAESLACGTPAVALAYSSLPEVVGPAGVLVDEWALIDNIYSYFWATPKGGGYEAAVESLVADRELRERLGALGPSHVARFDWAIAAEQMDAILRGADAPTPDVPVERRMAALGLVTGGR